MPKPDTSPAFVFSPCTLLSLDTVHQIPESRESASFLRDTYILHLGTPQYQVNEFEENGLAEDSEKSLYCSVSVDLESPQSCSAKEFSFRWHVLTRGYSEVRGQGVKATQDLIVKVNGLQVSLCDICCQNFDG